MTWGACFEGLPLAALATLDDVACWSIHDSLEKSGDQEVVNCKKLFRRLSFIEITVELTSLVQYFSAIDFSAHRLL